MNGLQSASGYLNVSRSWKPKNVELKRRLGEDVVPIVHEPTSMQKLSVQEKVELFRSLYHSVEDNLIRFRNPEIATNLLESIK